jgi:threonine dehydrogenase-like Zn-dependent dehydrogenase
MEGQRNRVATEMILPADHESPENRFPERLRMASDGRAEPINYEESDVYDTLMERTGGRGPEACIDAVGLEAHAPGMLQFPASMAGSATRCPLGLS